MLRTHLVRCSGVFWYWNLPAPAETTSKLVFAVMCFKTLANTKTDIACLTLFYYPSCKTDVTMNPAGLPPFNKTKQVLLSTASKSGSFCQQHCHYLKGTDIKEYEETYQVPLFCHKKNIPSSTNKLSSCRTVCPNWTISPETDTFQTQVMLNTDEGPISHVQVVFGIFHWQSDNSCKI